MQPYKTILLENDGHIGTITLHRPEVMNAVNQAMIDELRDALAIIDKDTELRVLIITGAGKAFQAGADIAELGAMTPMQLLRWNEGLVRINASLEALRQPVIAALNGAAIGGGLELALACSLRVAAAGVKLALPEVKLGIIPGAGGTQRLPRLIGKGRATKMILTGETIRAEQAESMGLVDQVAPAGEALNAAKGLAKSILANAPIAVELAKNAIEIGQSLPLEAAVQYSQKNCLACFSTEDMREGTQAFLQKRSPHFRGN